MEYRCLKCGYAWIGRLGRKPKTCPKCCSYKWDVAKDIGVSDEVRACKPIKPDEFDEDWE